MTELFAVISWGNIMLLPWYILLAGGLFVSMHVIRAIRALLKRNFVHMFSSFIGVVVVLIFLSIGGQLYSVFNGNGVFPTADYL